MAGFLRVVGSSAGPPSLLCALLFATVHAQAPAPDEAALVEAFRQTRRMLSVDKPKEARALLEQTLELHAELPWTIHHLYGIEDLLTLCSFWERYERPLAQDVISGELEQWNEQSGLIDVRYRARPPQRRPRQKPRGGRSALEGLASVHDREDWYVGDKTLVHPLSFAGNYSVELSGGVFPADLSSLRCVLAAEWDRAYVAGFVRGNEALGNEWLGYVARSDATSSEQYEKGELKLPLGSEITLRFSVSGSNVSVSCNGKRICAIDKPGDLWGGFALLGVSEIWDVRIEGKAQPSWVLGRVDSIVQQNLARFSQDFDPRAQLPPKLRGRAEQPPTLYPPEKLLPGEPTAEDLKGNERVIALLEKGEHQDAYELASNVGKTKFSAPVSEWLLAQLEAYTSRHSMAVERLERLATDFPAFLPARVLRAELWYSEGRRERALAEAIELVAAHPQDPRALVLRAKALALLDRADEADALLRNARDAGFPPADFEEFQRTLDRTRNGPQWAKSYEYKSEHYHVRSDIGQALCFRAAQLLERFYAKYNAHIKRVTGVKKRFRVQLFSSEAGYHEFCEGLIGGKPEHTAGVYIPMLKQLMIWNLPEAEQMLATVVHEGFHQYLDQVAPTAPIWFNEGMAEYYGHSKLVDGQWKDGIVSAEHVETLRREGRAPLREFLRITHPEFKSEEVMRNYAQAWAFVHFLLESGKGRTELVARFLKELTSGKLADEAIDIVFTPTIVSSLEDEFAKFVAEL
jgi:tetratricopeptide (TPR) repeat protein